MVSLKHRHFKGSVAKENVGSVLKFTCLGHRSAPLSIKEGFTHGKPQKAFYYHRKEKFAWTSAAKQINFRKHFDTRQKFFLQNFLNDTMGEEESPVLVRKRSCIKRGERKKSECSSA